MKERIGPNKHISRGRITWNARFFTHEKFAICQCHYLPTYLPTDLPTYLPTAHIYYDDLILSNLKKNLTLL